MERKTKHRMLGMIVMTALVVALLPLFHGGNHDVKLDPQLVSAPPFPEQSAQVSDNTNPEFKMALANQKSPIPINNNQDNESGFNQLPDDTINPNTSQAFVNKQAAQSPHALPIEDDNDSAAVLRSQATTVSPDTQSIFRNSLESELEAAAKPAVKTIEHHPSKVAASIKVKQAKIDNNGLFKLKTSAWVIQLGNYQDKVHAIKLVNRLRANGYSAFIQEASSGTRVYVGPETQETAARSVAVRLADEMKIQGVVISYKPLAL